MDNDKTSNAQRIGSAFMPWLVRTMSGTQFNGPLFIFVPILRREFESHSFQRLPDVWITAGGCRWMFLLALSVAIGNAVKKHGGWKRVWLFITLSIGARTCLSFFLFGYLTYSKSKRHSNE